MASGVPPKRAGRDEFSPKVRAQLEARASSTCSLCGELTTGPGAASPSAVARTGIAAHITAAAPRGPRYDISLTREQRRDISNGIWTCSHHGRIVDSDHEAYSVEQLRAAKGA